MFRILFALPCAFLGWGGHASASLQEFPRLRTILPSGALIFVENMPEAKQFSVQLVAASYGVRESTNSHGHRHLLEHLLVKGPQKDLRFKLESQGLVLTADTYRDAMVFAIAGASDKIEPAIEAIAEILAPLQTTPEEVQREARVVAEELALASPSKRLSSELWQLAFGDSGLDPIGSAEAMAKATPESLELLRRRHFAPQNLVLSISGPVNIDAITRRCRTLLAAEKGPFEPDPSRRQAKQGRASATRDASGVAVVFPGWNEPETASLLVAAYALAAEHGKARVIFTPSLQPGLVIVASEEPALMTWMAKLAPGQIDGMLARGIALADDSIEHQLRSPDGNAFLRGFLYSQSPSANPDGFRERIRAVDLEQFRAAVAKFREEARQ